MENLEKAFAPGDIHTEMYERLFTDDSTAAICDFVGIDHHPADFELRLNVSPRQSPTLPDDVVATVARAYEPTYAAAARLFGDSAIAAHWPSARLL